MNEKRPAFIQALRNFADFLEQNEAVMTPGYCVINVFPNTREELQEQARAAKSWEKIWGDGWFSLRKVFGDDDIVFDVSVPRETVCRKVVTGTRIEPAQPERVVEEYTWECDEPLLVTK